MTTYQTATLPNGIRIIHEPNPINVAYCGYAVNAGTRDERKDEQGMAHFVEHLIFKRNTQTARLAYPEPNGKCGVVT